MPVQVLGKTLRNLRKFVGPSYKSIRLFLGALGAMLLSVWCFMQTELFLSYMPFPTDAQIIEHMRSSKELQERQRQAGLEANRAIPKDALSQLWFEEKFKDIKEAHDKVVKDGQLEDVLKSKFKVGLEEVKVVVIPAWELDMHDYCPDAGITYPAAWEELEKAKAENAEGVTLRDRGPDQINTLDGVPRIFLMNKAFISLPHSLQRVMAHELLHAMNIPAYRWTIKLPGFKERIPLTRMQTDLTYLKEYRWYIRKAGLETWDQNAAGFLTGFFLVISAINLIALLRHRRRRPGIQ